MERLTTRTRHAARRLVIVGVALVLASAAGGCGGGGSTGPLRVQAVITPDGSFDVARVSRVVLAVDGDGDARVTVDVPLAGGLGNGATAVYQAMEGSTLVLAAVALDASGARVASGVGQPVRLSASAVASAPITLSSAGRVDAGVAPPADMVRPLDF